MGSIRVIKKIKRLLESLWSNLEDLDKLLITEIVNHATLLSWLYYIRGQSLPLDFIINRLGKSFWIDRNLQKRELSADEKQHEEIYRSIISQVDLSPSIFDEQIIQYLKYGYADADKIQDELTKALAELDYRKVQEKVLEAQKKYSDSFSDNKDEIVSFLISILERSSQKLTLNDCSNVMSLLDNLGQDVTAHLDRYVNFHKEEIEKMNYHDSQLDNSFNYQPLLERCKQVRSSKTIHDIDTVTLKIAIEKSWNPGDINFLASITQDELYQWVKGNPLRLVTKLREGLLSFKNMSGSSADENEKYQAIYQNARHVVIRLANENSLNHMRARYIYDIEIP